MAAAMKTMGLTRLFKLFSAEPKREPDLGCTNWCDKFKLDAGNFSQRLNASYSPCRALGRRNEFGSNALSDMPKRQSQPTGPMSVQPLDHGSNMPTPLLPAMPAVADPENATPRPKRQATRAEAVRVAKAKIMRRQSLRIQRQAQKD